MSERDPLREALATHEANLLSLGRTMVDPRPENWMPILGERIAAAVNGLTIVRQARAALTSEPRTCDFCEEGLPLVDGWHIREDPEGVEGTSRIPCTRV